MSKIRDGFKKVKEGGFSYITATFFNPETFEEYDICVRDLDYYDGSRDDREHYNAPLDEEARKIWLRHHGVVQVGDTVRVVKGRKYPKGLEFVVKAIYPINDKYGRWVANYAYFAGGKINVDNVEIVA